jgi:hypothetical protein
MEGWQRILMYPTTRCNCLLQADRVFQKSFERWTWTRTSWMALGEKTTDQEI